MIRQKKFAAHSTEGLGISKSGKYQIPYLRTGVVIPGKNAWGQNLAISGDYAVSVSHSGLINPLKAGVVQGINILTASGILMHSRPLHNEPDTDNYWWFVLTKEQYFELLTRKAQEFI